MRWFISFVEAGPFAVWSAKGASSAEGLEFRNLGGGLWQADMPIGRRDVELVLTRP
ncbi:MAG: hypothetical protein NTW86_02775 [Candidatus Sumerlaeota bacterium]|nr:hypothetical protein [Candidatus Sumerlaeota bacterium]